MFEEPFEFPPRKILSPCQVDATQTTRASGSCPGKIGERTCPLNISRVCTRRKEKEKNLFFICCRDVLLFPGRRILSQRLLQGILRQPFLHRSFSILENEHVARLALAPTHPSSIKLYARNIFPAWECERKSNFNRAGISFRPEENAISLINIGKGRERATIKRIRRVSTDILGGLGRIKRKRRIRRREAERRKRGSGGFSGHRFVGRTRGRAASSKLSSSSSSSR